MPEPIVGAKRPEERLLERVVRPVTAEPPAEKPQHLGCVLGVEGLERRDRRHGIHHLCETRGRARACEIEVPSSCGAEGDAFRDVPCRRRGSSRRVRLLPNPAWRALGRLSACASLSSGTSSGSASRVSTRVPAPGEISHSFDQWEEAGGGGGVAALQLALLADEAHLFTALGDDDLGRRAKAELEARGSSSTMRPTSVPSAGRSPRSTRTGERTITTVGPKARPRGHDDRLPWHELGTMDAVFFVAGRRRRPHQRAARARPDRDVPRARQSSSERPSRSTRSSGAATTRPSATGPASSIRRRSSSSRRRARSAAGPAPAARSPRPRLRARSSTHTARETPSRPGSRSRSAPGLSPRTRSPSRHVAAPRR